MSDKSAEARERAEARSRKAEQAAQASREAMALYAADAQAVEDRIVRLRALRLARDAAVAQAAPVLKPVPRPKRSKPR